MKQTILDTISDLCIDFLFYDRKEDEQLSSDQLEEAVKSGEITIDDMVNEFRKHIEEAFKDSN
jgi:predicted RNA-binding protein associated with RNAse of E/G family